MSVESEIGRLMEALAESSAPKKGSGPNGEMTNRDHINMALTDLMRCTFTLDGMVNGGPLKSPDKIKEMDPLALLVGFVVGQTARDFDVLRRTDGELLQLLGSMIQENSPEATHIAMFVERAVRPLERKYGKSSETRRNKTRLLKGNNYIDMGDDGKGPSSSSSESVIFN